MDLRRLVGRNVRRLRDERGLTQEQLAERVELDQRYISQLETGQRNPTLTRLEIIAERLGVQAVDLFRQDVEPPPKG